MAATVAGVSMPAPATPPVAHVDAAAPVPRWWEDAAISLGLVAVQLAGAAYMVVLTPILALGLDPLFLITFGSLSTGILTLPFALNLERYEVSRMHAQCNPMLIHFPIFIFLIVWQEQMAVGAEQPSGPSVCLAVSGRVRN
jgi:hypothetical protein